jgi:hypothetical protein
MTSQRKELQTMAEDCRKLAAAVEDAAIRSRLLTVAKHFELLSERHRPWDVGAAYQPEHTR